MPTTRLLRLEVVIDARLAELAAGARPLKPSPRQLNECGLRAAEPDDARAHRAPHTRLPRLIFRDDGGGEAEVRAIRELDRMRFVGESGDREHWAEYLRVHPRSS